MLQYKVRHQARVGAAGAVEHVDGILFLLAGRALVHLLENQVPRVNLVAQAADKGIAKRAGVAPTSP